MRQVRQSPQDPGGAQGEAERGGVPLPAPDEGDALSASILAPRLRAAGDALVRLEGKVELARTLLSTVGIRGPRSRFAVEQASARLERAQITAGLARVLLRRDAAWAGLAARAAMARREVTDLRPILYQVHEVLARLAQRSTAIRPTPGEIGDIDRAARAAAEALNVLQAVAEVLLDLADRPDLALGPGDLRALGLAYAGGTLAPADPLERGVRGRAGASAPEGSWLARRGTQGREPGQGERGAMSWSPSRPPGSSWPRWTPGNCGRPRASCRPRRPEHVPNVWPGSWTRSTCWRNRREPSGPVRGWPAIWPGWPASPPAPSSPFPTPRCSSDSRRSCAPSTWVRGRPTRGSGPTT